MVLQHSLWTVIPHVANALLQATGCQMELSAEQVDAGEVDKLVQGIVQCANEVPPTRCAVCHP